MENSLKKTDRKKYIDISKGIGIYTIVLVHFTVHGSVLSQILLSFCVPFFFIISGMLFSAKREPKDFFINMLQKVVIPLIVYGIIDAFFTMFRKWIIEGEGFSFITFAKIIAKIFFVSGTANTNGPLWYLPTLIWIQIIMYFSCRLNKKWFPLITGILMLIIGYFIHFKGPFRVGQVPVAAVYFCIGMYIKPYMNTLSQGKLKFVICPAALALFAVFCYLNGFSEMAALNYGNNYIFYFIAAISATIGIMTFSMIIKSNRLLEFFGKNSLTVMCTHYHFARYIIPWILQAMGKEEILTSIAVEIIFSVLLMALMIPVIILINKKIPVLTGNYKLKIFNKT
ncbi:MAG: acyltransferase family protein [Ruminococcus sp.]